MTTIGSLFSGAGGLDRGVQDAIGGELAWMAEHYRPARAVLRANHPDVQLYDDIGAVDWSTVEPVDVITAGFPCQKLSLLGRREGLRPTGASAELFAQPSGWDLTVRVLRAVRPTLVILENVSALLTAPVCDGANPGTAFGAILDDLADLGFDAEWVCADASAAGAPHRRRRLFIAAADPERLGRLTWRHGHPQGGAGEVGRDDAAGGAGRVDRSAEPVYGRHRAAVARWADRLGRGAPWPVVNGARNPRLWEWLQGLPEGWLSAAPMPSALRVAGNGVVPQQAAAAVPVLLARLLGATGEAAA